MADRKRVNKAMAFLTDDRARANMPDARKPRPVEYGGRDYKRELQREATEQNPEMDAKVKQWLKDHPEKRYLMDLDANDPDAFMEMYHAGKTDQDLTAEEAAMVRYGLDHGSLWDDYEENLSDEQMQRGMGDTDTDELEYRRNQYVEKKPVEKKDEPAKAASDLDSEEKGRRERQDKLMSFLKGRK